MTEESKSLPTSINFDYIKSNLFRVVHADGAFFALTNQGGLTVSFFSERQPIPRRITHKVNSDGSLGQEITEQRVVRDAVIRDTEVAIHMSAETAKRVKEKLEEMLNAVDEIMQQTKNRENE